MNPKVPFLVEDFLDKSNNENHNIEEFNLLFDFNSEVNDFDCHLQFCLLKQF